MSLDRLPLSVFLGGIAALAATLLLLHLLRVRLRRVPVDSLLFFARLGTVQKPRVLPGRPARWQAFLLSLLALAGLWTAWAGLSQPADGPSRVVLLDAGGTSAGESGAVWETRTQAARELLAEGLGPDGAVLAFAEDVWWSLAADSPDGLLDEAAASGPRGGHRTGLFAALRAARARLQGREGDEIVVLGGPASLPPAWDGVPVRRRVVADEPPALGVVDAVHRDDSLEVLVTAPSACTVQLVWQSTASAERRVTPPPDGVAVLRFDELPAEETEIAVRIVCEGQHAVWRTQWRPRRPVPVRFDDVPAAVALAVAADPGFVEATGPEAAVLVTTRLDHAQDLPALVLADETAPAPRAPARTDDCPLPLSLRDRAQIAPALRAESGEEVWVFDRESGAPLVAASDEGIRRVRATRWLLEPAGHRDVPLLVLGALRWLTRADATPAVDPTVAPRAAAQETEPRTAEGHPVRGPLPAALLLLAVILLLADAVVYHRGRMP